MKTPSRVLVFIAVCLAAIFALIVWEMKLENFAIFIIPCVVLLAIVIVMSPQIDWWWYKRNPRDIDPMLANLFQLHLPFYQRLSDGDKLLFRQRVDLYLMTVEFVVPSKDEDKTIPEDLKHWIAAFSVMTTWGKEKIENEKFEKIVAYMNNFPSPMFPHHFHSAESFQEDGVLLFALEPMIHAVQAPEQCFNPVLYEYCKVFSMTYWSKDPHIEDTHWVDLEKISKFSKDQVYRTIGLPDIDLKAVAMSFYILFPNQFKTFLPKEFEEMKGVLGF